MPRINRTWFDDALHAKRLSQRGLAKLLGCNPSSVSRLLNGKRSLRFDEAERLAVFLGVPPSEVLNGAGINIANQGNITRIVGYIDGQGEAHIDWNADAERVPSLPDLPAHAVAVQYRTAMTAWESLDGWTIYVEPPNDRIENSLNRLSLVTLASGLTVLGFLRRGYKPGAYNVHNFGTGGLDNMEVSWATPVLLLRP